MEERFLQAGSVRIPLSEIRFSFARSGGPGGQNVNKVETKVEARFTPAESSVLTQTELERIRRRLACRLTKEGELIVVSDHTRHRERNRQDALERLGKLIAEALRIRKKRRPTRPTRASRERRLATKKRRGRTKDMRRPPQDDQ